jgi:hypothetical protein
MFQQMPEETAMTMFSTKAVAASVAVLTSLLLVQPAAAISRYNSQSLTCEGAKDLIRQQGAVILRYQSKRVANLPLYDRYVRNSGQCDSHEFAKWTRIPTKDDPSCRLLACETLDGLTPFVPNYSL